jgi:hypothetical protein
LIKYFIFVGEIKKIPGSNPHRLNSIAENEIENGKELPEQCKGRIKRKPQSALKKQRMFQPYTTSKTKNGGAWSIWGRTGSTE